MLRWKYICVCNLEILEMIKRPFNIHPPVTIISKSLYFKFIQLMMYMVFIIDHVQHLMNEPKMLIFAYINDRKVYLLAFPSNLNSFNLFLSQLVSSPYLILIPITNYTKIKYGESW